MRFVLSKERYQDNDFVHVQVKTSNLYQTKYESSFSIGSIFHDEIPSTKLRPKFPKILPESLSNLFILRCQPHQMVEVVVQVAVQQVVVEYDHSAPQSRHVGPVGCLAEVG